MSSKKAAIFEKNGTLVGDFNPSEKYDRQNGTLPQFRGEHKNIVETTTWDMFVLPTIQFSGKMLVFQWELNNENGAERGVKHSCRFKMKLKNQPLEKNSFSILASISHFGGIQKLQELSISFTAIKQKW